jgi:hypothetical protein
MFLSAFFHIAAVAPARQRTFRYIAGGHLATIGITVGAMVLAGTVKDPKALGNVLMVAGIVEGALLIGWRLTQLPKSQALEFLLVSPLRPPLVFLGEALVGLVTLALVTLAGLPILVYLASAGVLVPHDLFTLLLLPAVWGAVTGLGLTAWAFEPPLVRRWGERLVMAGVVFYLLVGVMAGENLPRWLSVFPPSVSRWFLDSFRDFHEYNPFGVMKFAMEQPLWAWPRVVWAVGAGLFIAAVLLARGAWRLQGHFQEEHYRPVLLKNKRPRPEVGEHPLTWWAVKRVTKFGGRINLWLAGGFAALYAAYILFRGVWPSWLGTHVFVLMGDMGGIPILTTALVLLAAVPAAFQYGVWDSNVPDRCRRLELLLITDLDGPAYWQASLGAAWNRGRGYLGAAALLWAAGLIAGQITLAQVLASVACGVILWGLYFALGFWAFIKGMQASLVGMGLTLVLPMVTLVLARQGWVVWTSLLPPGSIYLGATTAFTWSYLLGPFIGAAATLGIAQWSLPRCERQLRHWYELNH